ncbi:MAG: phage portal protein [Rickettsiaceae bacterium]|nr:MAG: phage portal protein [Rickettsiaceae bacterium]
MLNNLLNKILKPKSIKKSQNFFNLVDDNYFSTQQNCAGIEAYYKNVIVYRCVNLISQSASHVPWLVKKIAKNGAKIIVDNHPVLRLMHRPNPERGGADFFCEVIANKLLYGSAYILSSSLNNSPPKEIYLLSPNSIEIVINKGKTVAYKYSSLGGDKFFHIDPLKKTSKILHLKSYNPTNMGHGLSCLNPASLSIESHQQATLWNNALLKNGARPSGALIVKDSNSYLTDEQFSRLQEQLNEKYLGSNNSGRPLLLEGGLDWREMSVSPKDMDFIESKNSASREIALAFGVPPQLLGINGDNTYSNMQEARLALWEETLIPLLDKLSDALGNWLSHWYNEEIIVDFDRDAISVLTEKRENLWSKISAANFMTLNEKRAFVGLAPLPNGDLISTASENN